MYPKVLTSLRHKDVPKEKNFKVKKVGALYIGEGSKPRQ